MFLPTLFDLQTVGAPDIALAAFIIVFADAIVALSYAVPLSMTRNLFSEALLRKVNTGASIGIILVGLVIGYSALPAKDLLSVF